MSHSICSHVVMLFDCFKSMDVPIAVSISEETPSSQQPKKAMPSDPTLEKRERLLKIYKARDCYEYYKEYKCRDFGDQLPTTPRADVTKRIWEREFYTWRKCLETCAEFGPIWYQVAAMMWHDQIE